MLAVQLPCCCDRLVVALLMILPTTAAVPSALPVRRALAEDVQMNWLPTGMAIASHCCSESKLLAAQWAPVRDDSNALERSCIIFLPTLDD